MLAYDKGNPRKDRPDEAHARSWMSCELALQDAERFEWSRYRNEEAWINCWHEGDAHIGWSGCHPNPMETVASLSPRKGKRR